MHKILISLLGLGFIGLASFTVYRDCAQTQMVSALNLKISDLEKARLHQAFDRDELISNRQGFADAITGLKAQISELETGIQTVARSVSIIDSRTTSLNVDDTEKRLKTLELRRWVVDPMIEVVKLDSAEISSINLRLTKVEEKLKMDYP